MTAKPCPFCVGDGETNLDRLAVECTKCGAVGPVVPDEKVEAANSDEEIEAAAVRLWNERVQS